MTKVKFGCNEWSQVEKAHAVQEDGAPGQKQQSYQAELIPCCPPHRMSVSIGGHTFPEIAIRLAPRVRCERRGSRLHAPAIPTCLGDEIDTGVLGRRDQHS